MPCEGAARARAESGPFLNSLDEVVVRQVRARDGSSACSVLQGTVLTSRMSSKRLSSKATASEEVEACRFGMLSF